MVRGIHSVFAESRLDEATTVLAYAYAQSQAVANRKLKYKYWVLYGILLSLMPLALALILQGRLTLLPVSISVATLVPSAALALYCWWPEDPPVQGLTKVFWRLWALPYSSDAVLVWDSLGNEQQQLVLFEVDTGGLGAWPQVSPAVVDVLHTETASLIELRDLRSILRGTSCPGKAVAFVPASAEVSQPLGRLLSKTEALPEPALADGIALPSRIAGDFAELCLLIDRVAQFLRSPYEGVLTGLCEHVDQKVGQLLQSLGQVDRSSATGENGVPSEDVMAQLTSIIDQLFAPVLESLRSEVEPELHRLELQLDQDIKDLTRRRGESVGSLEGERDLELQGVSHVVAQRETELQEAQQRVSQLRTAERDLLFKTVSSAGGTMTPEAVRRLQEERDQKLLSVQGERRRAERDVRLAETAIREANVHREQVIRRWQAAIERYRLTEHQDIQERQELYEQQRRALIPHIEALEAEKGRLLKCLQELRDNKVLGATSLEESILAARRRALESVRADIVDIAKRLKSHVEVAREIVRRSCWSVSSVPEVPGEYLIPIWFVLHRKSKCWQPFLTVSESVQAELGGDEDLAVQVQGGGYDAVLEYVGRSMDDERVSAVLSSASVLAQPDRREKLLLELGKMHEQQLVSWRLLERVQKTFARIR